MKNQRPQPHKPLPLQKCSEIYPDITMAQAFQNGVQAGRKNHPVDGNPFMKCEFLSPTWFLGWQQGQSEFVETQPSGYHTEFGC